MDDYLGRVFEMGEVDCYTLLRDYYRQEYGIALADIARPNDFWEEDLDLYGTHAEKQGFVLMHDHQINWRKGDVILMAIQSKVPNHVAILQDGDQILHHMYGRLSTVEPFRGIWRNTMVCAYRHRLVNQEDQIPEQVDFLSMIPTRIRRKLDETAP